MKILIFIVLVSVIGGVILTAINKPIRAAKDYVIDQVNDSFEEKEGEKK